MAQPFVQNEHYLVHVGDGCLLFKNMDHFDKLLDASERLKADATFLVLEIEKTKQYGIIEGIGIEKGILKVTTVTEKPEHPKTNLAIMTMYVFYYDILALEATKPSKNGEVQLTDVIQHLVNGG